MTFGSIFGRTFSPTFQPSSQAAGGAWSPTDITGCKLWVDFSDANYLFTDAGLTKVSSDGDAIYQASDKSGNSANVTQLTASKRPLYKTGIQNGLSASYYDGDDLLTNASCEVVNTNGSWTAFAVARATDLTSYRGILTQDNSSSASTRIAQFLRYVKTTGYLQSITFNTASSPFFASKNAYTTGFSILSAVRTTSTIIAYVNNSAGTSTNTTGTPQSGAATLGIGHTNLASDQDLMKGYIGEVIIYNSALSDTDRGTVETYLNNKWAIY